MNNISKVKNCYGCMGCSFVCPNQAINFKLDKNGFYKPYIDNNKCVNCGLCLKKCVAVQRNEMFNVQKEIVGWSSNSSTRLSCSSGGAFYEIARRFIQNGGVVYGVAFSSPFNVEHIRVSDVVSLEKIKGSKYIQSNMLNCFQNLRKDLENGKKVLFSGTPCQVGIIRNLFGKYKNLFLIDVICFGYMSNGVYQNYLSGIEKKYNSKIKNLIFRDSSHMNMLHIELENGCHYFYQMRDNPKNGIYKFFCDRSLIKETCSICKYRSEERIGDISLSDYPYTLSDKIDPNRYGVSIIYINTGKGFDLMRDVEFYIISEGESNLISKFKNNYDLKITCKNRRRFFKKYHTFRKKPVKLVHYIDTYREKLVFAKKIKNYIRHK